MPRSLNYVPKYRKHKASGQAIVTIAGKDHYLGTYGTKGSRAAYDRVVGEWIARGRSAPAEDTRFTCTELAASYWAHAKVYYRKNGKMTDHGVIRIVLREFRAMYGPDSRGGLRTAQIESMARPTCGQGQLPAICQ